MRHIILSTAVLILPFGALAEEQSRQQEQTAQEQQPQAAQADMQQAGEIEIARAQFASEVREREPVDQGEGLTTAQDPIYFFTEVKNAAGETITHRWIHDGEVVAEVPLNVGSNSWRTWSSKEMLPEWGGEWTVEVLDSQGNVISEESITIESAGAEVQEADYSPEEDQAMQDAADDGETNEDGND